MKLSKPLPRKTYDQLLMENAGLRRRLSEGIQFTHEQLIIHDREVAQKARQGYMNELTEWKHNTTREIAEMIDQGVRAEISDDERESLMSQSIVFLIGISIKVLRSEFGFGFKRLSRFAEGVMDEYNNGEYELDELREQIYKDTGVKFYTIEEAEREGLDV